MRILFTLLLLLFAWGAGAQQPGRAQLEANRKELMDAIHETEVELENIKKDKTASMGQLRALQSKLAQRRSLINNINEELSDIDHTIRSSSTEVLSLKARLEQLKIRFSQSIRYAYATRSSYDMIAYFFSSRDFNDAMKRMKYLKRFRELRRQQVVEIRTTQAQLQHKIGVLNVEKAQKGELLHIQVQQNTTLVAETEQTNKVVQELKDKEKDLLKKIKKDKAKAASLNRTITQVIEREMAKASRIADAGTNTEKEPGKTTGHKTKREAGPLVVTPTDMALGNTFESNKGRFSWPVARGVITDHYGIHRHPLAPEVEIGNDGVDIKTAEGASAKAVFGGIVSSVSNMDGLKIVVLKHGNFFTVYNNLESTPLHKDDVVTTGQVLGTVANNEYNEPTIKFQIWKAGAKGMTTLNPEEWLGKTH